MGDFEVVYISSPDIDRSFRTMSESSAAFDVDWRKLTKDFHGVDFSTGVSAFPEVELVFEMGKGELSGAKPFLFAAPIGREGGAKLRDTAKALMGARNAEYLRARERIGVKREAVFLQSTPVGQVMVFYWLAADPTASLKQQMDSTDPFDQWLRAQIGQVHPMPSDVLFATVSQNKIAVEYPRSE